MKAAFLSGSLIASKGSARPSAVITQPLELIHNNGNHEAKRPVPIVTPAPLTPHQTKSHRTNSEDISLPCGLHDNSCTGSGSENTAGTKTLRRDSHGRVRMSVRMTPDQHLKLKILSIHSQKSVQALMIEALDKQLADYARINLKGQCICMNGHNAD